MPHAARRSIPDRSKPTSQDSQKGFDHDRDRPGRDHAFRRRATGHPGRLAGGRIRVSSGALRNASREVRRLHAPRRHDGSWRGCDPLDGSGPSHGRTGRPSWSRHRRHDGSEGRDQPDSRVRPRRLVPVGRRPGRGGCRSGSGRPARDDCVHPLRPAPVPVAVPRDRCRRRLRRDRPV
jgi:hypothetical protein